MFVEEDLAAAGQHEIRAGFVRRVLRGRETPERFVERIKTASPLVLVLDRAARHAGVDRLADRLGDLGGRVPVAGFEVAVDGEAGCFVEQAGVRNCIIARDGAVASAGTRPRERGREVAMASKPKPFMSFAVPASHGLGMTNEAGARMRARKWLRCSSELLFRRPGRI
jgi:hypothetical protein